MNLIDKPVIHQMYCTRAGWLKLPDGLPCVSLCLRGGETERTIASLSSSGKTLLVNNKTAAQTEEESTSSLPGYEWEKGRGEMGEGEKYEVMARNDMK